MDQNDQKWLERLLRRLHGGKEKRWVEWREEIQDHLINALQTPGMSVKPNNMPAGLWYWVSEVGAGKEGDVVGGYCLLVMTGPITGKNCLSLSMVMFEMADMLEKAGFKCHFDPPVPVANEVRPFLHPNTRRLARKVDGRPATRFFVFRVRFWREAANSPQ